MRSRFSSLVALRLIGALCSTSASAALSLTDLYQAVPAPPKDVPTATAWIRDGKVVAPEIVSLEAHLKTEEEAVAATASKAATAAPGQDSPAVLEAVAAYQGYAATNSQDQSPAAVQGGRAKWLAGRFAGLRKRIKDPAGLIEVRDQELAAYRALSADWQPKRSVIVAQANKQLMATGDPTAVKTPQNRAALEKYRLAMLEEVEVLLGLTRLSVERAGGLPSAEPSTVEPSANTLWDLMSDPRKKPAAK